MIPPEVRTVGRESGAAPTRSAETNLFRQGGRCLELSRAVWPLADVLSRLKRTITSFASLSLTHTIFFISFIFSMNNGSGGL